MIITCPKCKKKFNVDRRQIPEEGRLLKCRSCYETWLFKINEKNINNIDQVISPIKEEINETTIIKKKEKIDTTSNLRNNKGSELVKYKATSSFTIAKFFNYLIVMIISFFGIIIILDTFKSPLSNIFPNLELILYNLFETLKDLLLFVKDLN